MPLFDGKDGKKSYHMNPQAGRSLRGKSESGSEHSMVHTGGEHGGHDGHEFNGEKKAHHVEIHHGGHPHGQPPDEGSASHHTIAHGENGEQDIRNHGSMEEAKEHISNAMHDTCPECGADLSGGSADPGGFGNVGGSPAEGAM